MDFKFKYGDKVRTNHPFYGERQGTVSSYINGTSGEPEYRVELLDPNTMIVEKSAWFKTAELVKDSTNA